MAQALKLLFALLLLILVQGNGQRCRLSCLEIHQSNTGMKAGVDPVFEVAVKNLCRCALKKVYLRSEGFASSMVVDPRLFRRDGAGYLLGNGRRIPPSASIVFRYAWDRAFRITPASLEDECSYGSAVEV